MKKVISVVLSCIILMAAAGIPAAASTVSYDVTKSKAASITAASYSNAYDFSTESTDMIIEGGNISFNYNDYVDYVLNVEADGLYTIGIYSSSNDGNVSILDLLVDGKTQYRQGFPGKGFFNYTTVNSYIYLTAGTHTLRLLNINGGMYLSKLTVTYKSDVVQFGEGENSIKEYVADGLPRSVTQGSYIAFAANVQNSGVYQVKLTASRRTSADIYIYTNDGFVSSQEIPSGLKAQEIIFYTELSAGFNIVKMKAAAGSLYATNLTYTYVGNRGEEVFDVAEKVENAEDADEVYSIIKENKSILGLDIESLVSTLTYPQFVFVRLCDRNFANSRDFISAIYTAVEAEKSAPSVTTAVSGTSLKVTAKTDIYKTDGIFAAAIYNGGRLISMNYQTFEKGADVSFSLTGYADGMTVKFFTFDTINEINPSELSNGICNEIYVSNGGSDTTGDGSVENPYATIKKAKEATESLVSSMTGDIAVNIEPGYYELSETEVFSEKYGGTNDYKVIYRGTDPDNPPVISGGKAVTGWQKENGGIYSAPLAGNQVRDLFVGEYPAIRARSKYSYTLEEYIDDMTISVSKDGMPASIAHPEDLVFVWTLYWATQYTPVSAMTDNGDTVAFTMEDIFGITPSTANIAIDTNKRFYMENALEFLDEPGEFYHDYHAGKIYYMPYPEQNMDTVETYVSNLDKMIEVSGSDKDARVKNIVFDNISFKYGTRNSDSVMQIQADQHMTADGEAKLPAQFVVNYADGIAIRNCEFSCIGSNALEFFNGVSNSEVKGNLIKDIGGTGISIGNFMRPRTDDEGEMCNNITVTDNVLRRTSLTYRGTTAIAVYYENDIDIVHNDIEYLPYTGITAGWGWGTARERFGNINISNNRIHDVIRTLTDGGHIYTLGNMPGSVISENYMTKSGDYRGGIYTDSGSQNISLLRNVCDNSSLWWHVGLYYTKDMTADGNITPRNFVNDSGENIVVKNHTEVSNGNFEAVASDIISKAGVRDEYKHLTENTDIPSWMTDPLKLPLDTYRDAQETWVEAEDFLPGFGTGYFVKNFNEPYNNIYRPEGLNLYRNYQTNKGYYIHRVAYGDWMSYNMTVPEDGIYFLEVKAANGYDDSYDTTLDVSVDGKLMLDNAKFPTTVQWHNFTPVKMGQLNLTKGTHTVKLAYAGAGFHIDALRLVKPPTVRVAMSDHTSAYCALKKTNALYIEGGNTTWHINDWAEYQVTITEPGKYTFGMEFGSSVGSGLRNVVKVNGTEALNVIKYSAGTYSDKKDVDFGEITFASAGTYTIRVENTGGNGGHYTGDIYLKYAGPIS